MASRGTDLAQSPRNSAIANPATAPKAPRPRDRSPAETIFAAVVDVTLGAAVGATVGAMVGVDEFTTVIATFIPAAQSPGTVEVK